MVGAALGLERTFRPLHRRAQPDDQLLEHMVRTDGDDPPADLGRNVPVAQVPGQPGEPGGIARHHLEHRLGGRPDPDPVAVVEAQPVSGRHRHRPPEVEQHRFAVVELQQDPAAVPGVVVERDAAARRVPRPGPGRSVKTGPAHQNRKYR